MRFEKKVFEETLLIPVRPYSKPTSKAIFILVIKRHYLVKCCFYIGDR